MSEHVLSDMRVKRTFRSTSAFEQTDQNPHWAPFGKPRIQRFFMRTAKVADVQVDLSLRKAQMSVCTFSHNEVHVFDIDHAITI